LQSLDLFNGIYMIFEDYSIVVLKGIEKVCYNKKKPETIGLREQEINASISS
jgi:hypothetical protein